MSILIFQYLSCQVNRGSRTLMEYPGTGPFGTHFLTGTPGLPGPAFNKRKKKEYNKSLSNVYYI
jgi:hypothetical protein